MMAADSEVDVQFMRRAIRLAMNGRGRVEPNPMVGCVIVKEGRVIGEGYHQQYGQPHAEPNALAACSESQAGATVYVTLEPCCHVNKQTPPCVPKLIEANVGRVVVGCSDPNPEVNGKGIAMLRAAEIRVDTSRLEAEAKQLIALFISKTTRTRPYVTLKWAQTADGKVAGAGGAPLQITNAISRNVVHELRSRCDGILVGVNTVLSDDPTLNARFAQMPRHPARFILDRDLRTPVDAKIVRDRSASTTIFTRHATDGPSRRRRDSLDAEGVCVTLVPEDENGRLHLAGVLSRVHGSSCYDLLVEPGPTLAASFLAENLADRLWVFHSTIRVDDPSAPLAVAVPAHYVESGRVNLGGDTLIEYLNPRSEVFFAAEASADLVLARGGDLPSRAGHEMV